MNLIFGQEKLCNKILNLSIATFPHTLMLVGDKGSGKSLLVEFISNTLQLDVITMNEFNADLLLDIQISSTPKIYVFSDLTIKEQNSLLKFFEEPNNQIFIILLTTTKDSYLDTICNRCQIWNLEKYSKEQLHKFCYINNINLTDDLFSIIKTPGDVLNLSSESANDLFNLSNKVIEKIQTASYGNILNIPKKFEDNSNLDIDIFFRLLLKLAYDRCISNIPYSSDVYQLTNQLVNDSHILHINKLNLLENYLFKLRMLYDS